MTDSEARDRAARRRARRSEGWRRDPKIERMIEQLERDPEEFAEVYGARGSLIVGLYERGRDAAEGIDPPDAA